MDFEDRRWWPKLKHVELHYRGLFGRYRQTPKNRFLPELKAYLEFGGVLIVL